MAVGVWDDFKGWATFSAWSYLYIAYLLYFGLKVASHWYGITNLVNTASVPSTSTMAIVGIGALWGTNVLAMWRRMRRVR